ncbi:MAG: alginate export family protein [Methylococcaceae bacterium]|nr:alginate export family protein [Methylococcaceae bacterium]
MPAMAMAVMGWGLPVGPAACVEEAPPWGRIDDQLRITGELRGRYEAWNYFQPKPAVNDRNDYDFWALRARLGVLLTTPYLDGYVQGEYTGLYGLPTDAVAVPGGPLGLGAAYYTENREDSPGDVHLKQVYVNFKSDPAGLPGISLKVGRFEIREGLEYTTGDAKFDGLKTTRASQRLLGPFDFTQATRNFDGFSVVYDRPALNLSLSGAHPTQGGFNIHAQDEISHIDLFYAALTGKKDAWLPGAEARLFYLYYGDDRNTQAVDNRPLAHRPRLNRKDLKIHTIGTHWLAVRQWGTGVADGLLWGAYQFGEWTNLDQQAWAVDAEVGYQWSEFPLKPWLRACYFRSSGDGNPRDGRHETFFQVLPTVRQYAKFPFFNLMNIQDVFAQLSVVPTPTTKVGIDIHHLSLSSSGDLFYGGAGATSRAGSFGYQGRPSGGGSHVGELVDLSFSHTLTRELSWNLYYGHAFGGNVIQSVYRAQKDANFAFAEFNLVF